MNCCSIRPSYNTSKFDDLKAVFGGSGFDAIGISETWLNENVSSCAVELPGYRFIRNDRSGTRRGGGVGIYISRKFVTKVVFRSSSPVAESVFIELHLGSVRVLFGVVYLPPPADIHSFEDLHSELFLNYSNIIVVGDFNLNQFDLAKSASVRSFCARNNLSICHNSVPTHYDVQHKSTSLIDFFLISNPSLINFSSQVQCPGISHHALVFASFALHSAANDDYVEYRDFRRMDWDGIARFCDSYNFSNILDEQDVDSKCFLFSSLIDTLFGFVPTRRCVRRTDDCWMKLRTVIYARSLRDLSFSTYLADPSEYNWKVFCKYRNRAKAVVRREKRRHFAKLFASLDTSGMWRLLKEAGCSRSVNVAFDCDIETLNEHFVRTPLDNVESHELPFDHSDGDDGLFSFRSVDEYDVVLALKKKARVVPIPKSARVRGPEDLRPISILPAVSKIVELLIKDQVLSQTRNAIFNSQYAFRAGHNTTSLLVHLTNTARSRPHMIQSRRRQDEVESRKGRD
ncbi:uncharacterized protein LOC142228619 [Haematobia irritans]|uniref:uncharacterized protein LOC142228619 n=1 Tax=Haematobia irritans TaxID=7368 RepID=UPI003F505D1F